MRDSGPLGEATAVIEGNGVRGTIQGARTRATNDAIFPDEDSPGILLLRPQQRSALLPLWGSEMRRLSLAAAAPSVTTF